MKIGSTIAFIIYALIMVGGFVWATYNVSAPYNTLAEFFTIGATAYWAKRLVQRSPKFGANYTNGNNGINGNVSAGSFSTIKPVQIEGED